MGIPALWKLLGPGELVSMAKLSSDHYRETGRAMKVAIDEPGWRFKNLTEAQVAAIRQKEPAANPIEKAIFWRICRLMRAHIHPVFVFDGPGRPWKRGRKGGNKVDYERTRLLVKLLDRMRIPHHRAPGEAEAECARMQQAGLVDAVWSDDADCLMFGASLLIKDHRGGTSQTAKHEDLVQTYRMSDITARHRLDAKAIVAYVTLVGGDYDMKGLLNCGEETVNQMARQGLLLELGHVLCAAQQERDLVMFRQQLMVALADVRKRIPIPADFPKWLAVRNYKSPKISTAEQLLALRLDHTLAKPIDHENLRAMLRDHFNIWTKGYLKYIGPLLLLRQLSATRPGEEQRNDPLGIRLVKRRKRAGAANCDAPDEIKIIYKPVALLPATIHAQPPEEDWVLLASKDSPFNPADPIEVETLRCLVLQGKGSVAFAAEMSSLNSSKNSPSRKRKSAQDEVITASVDEASEPQKRQRRSRPLKPESDAKQERERQRRLQQREQYNATRNVEAERSAPSISPAGTAHDMHVDASRSPVHPLRITSIDLTDSTGAPDSMAADSRPSSHLSHAHCKGENHSSGPSAKDILASVQNERSFASISSFDGLGNDDEALFEAETLTAIQRSLISSRMLADTGPSILRVPAEISVNVRVATPAAKSLLLSPRTAVRQRWAKEQTNLANPQGAPAYIDLTGD